jgi:hypothetical protein
MSELSWADLEQAARSNAEHAPEEYDSTIEWAVANHKGSTAPDSNDKKLSRGAKRFPWILKNWKRKQVCYD